MCRSLPCSLTRVGYALCPAPCTTYRGEFVTLSLWASHTGSPSRARAVVLSSTIAFQLASAKSRPMILVKARCILQGFFWHVQDAVVFLQSSGNCFTLGDKRQFSPRDGEVLSPIPNIPPRTKPITGSFPRRTITRSSIFPTTHWRRCRRSTRIGPSSHHGRLSEFRSRPPARAIVLIDGRAPIGVRKVWPPILVEARLFFSESFVTSKTSGPLSGCRNLFHPWSRRQLAPRHGEVLVSDPKYSAER